MEARVTHVIPAHHEHSVTRSHDQAAIMVTVAPGLAAVPSSISVTPGTLLKGQVITVAYADPAKPERGFRLA